jgi:hypothetical protein
MISRPNDHYTIHVLRNPAEPQAVDLEKAKADFRSIVSNLVKEQGIEKIIDGVDFMIQDAGNLNQLRSAMVRIAAAGIHDGREPMILSEIQQLLDLVGVVGAIRINREGVSSVDSTVITATSLREQFSDQNYDIVNLKAKMQELGISTEAAQQIAQMIQGLKRLAASA